MVHHYLANLKTHDFYILDRFKCNIGVNIVNLDSLDGTVLPRSELADRGGEEAAAGLGVLGVLLLLGVLLQAGQGPVLRETSSHWLCGF